MAKDNENFAFRYPDDHEASSSSTRSSGHIDLELRLAPPGLSTYIRSSSSSDSHSSTHNNNHCRSDNGVVHPPFPRLGDRSSTHDIIEGAVEGDMSNHGDFCGGWRDDQGVSGSYMPKNGGTGGDIPDSGGIGNGAGMLIDGGFGTVGLHNGGIGGGVIANPGFGVVFPERPGDGDRAPIHGGGGFVLPGSGRRQTRVRQRPMNAVDLAVPPFEWATNSFARIHQKDHLISKGIHTITGEVQCKKCEHRCTLEFDLQGKLLEVGSFIYHNKDILCHRATDNWTSPNLETCPSCDQPNSLKPIIPSEKGMINWLFLLLGQMIGCCTLEQLKFFCDKNSLHRTGAKDRLIFLTYLSLCDQLDPTGPFKLNGC